MTKHREITAAEMLDWRRSRSPLVRVRIARDAVPGGLSLAMAPVLVKWQSLSPSFGRDDHYILHNVNFANNPVGGTAVLASVKVFADSVESAELVTVISKVGHRETPVGHAMLRFIFRDDRRPIVLDPAGGPLANDASLEDLVLSWEAWRPPEASFDPLKGLDPTTYALTPRCLLGSVRCLTDSLLDRPWHCYPLKLPDVDHAYDELMYASFALADAVARQTAAHLIERRIERDRNLPEDYPHAAPGEWDVLASDFQSADIPENPIRDVLDGKIGYHLLQRCCITMALASVDWANHRIHRRAGLPEPERIRIAPRTMPAFLSGLLSGERTPLLLRVPAALHWIVHNHTVIAAKTYEVLDEVGLLQREGGSVTRYDFDNRRRTPYGEIGDHLIY
jgi:hypothetical protein